MQKLADHLKATGKKPAALARELGVTPSTITRLVKGERKPSVTLAMKIASITGLPLDDLLEEMRAGIADSDEKEAAA